MSDFLTRVRDRGLTGVRPIRRGDTLELPLRSSSSVDGPPTLGR